MIAAAIGESCTKASTWDPRRDAKGTTISYIDIGSVSQSEKAILPIAPIEADTAPSRARQVVKSGDILVSTVRPNLNAVAIVPEELDGATASTGFTVLRPIESKLDRNYLFHWLRTEAFVSDMMRQATGQSYPAVSDKIVKAAQIPLPPLEEQKRIAGILDQAARLCRLRRQALDRLNTLGQAIFHEMFGDPVSNERKWPVRMLRELSTKISSGSTPVGGKQNYVQDGIAFLRSQNVWRGRLDLDDVVYIDDETHKRMSKTRLKNGDILITKTGRINTENSSLGRAAIFNGEDDSANINGHVYLVRMRSGVLGDFVLFALTTDAYREYIRAVCVGGIDKRQINKEHIEEFPIIDPPSAEQKRFVEISKALIENKERNQMQLVLAEKAFAALQHRAFRGEL